MVQHREPSDEAPRLAALALELREAATRAGRPDVAAKADEALALLAEAGSPPQQGRSDTANAILRTLDGLGL
jgi:hypothetical protein